MQSDAGLLVSKALAGPGRMVHYKLVINLHLSLLRQFLINVTNGNVINGNEKKHQYHILIVNKTIIKGIKK